MVRDLLIVSELYYPEETSTGYFITGIAEGIAGDVAFNVRVLASQPTYISKGTTAPREEQINKVLIKRINAPSGNKNNLVGRVWNMMSLTIRMGIRMVCEIKKNDIVLVVTNPPSQPLLAGCISKLKGASCLLSVQDLYPDVLVPTGLTESRSLLYRTIDLIQRFILRRMTKIIVLGRDMEKRIRSKQLVKEFDMIIIPNWGDVDSIDPESRENNRIRSQHQLESKFIIQFSGNLGRTHGIEDLVEVARGFKENSDIHFLVFGWGAGRDWLIEKIDEYQLRNIKVLDPCVREELGDYLTACDLFFMPFKKGMEGISVPSRIYNVMAAGNAILAVAGDESELAYAVKEEEIGYVVEPGDVEAMTDRIHHAMSHKDELEGMRMRARKAVEQKYTKEIVINKYVSLLNNLF